MEIVGSKYCKMSIIFFSKDPWSKLTIHKEVKIIKKILLNLEKKKLLNFLIKKKK